MMKKLWSCLILVPVLFFSTALTFRGKAIGTREFVPPKGNLEVRVLTDRNIAVAGDYNGFVKEQYVKHYGDFLKRIANDLILRDWSVNFYCQFAADELLGLYRPKIAKMWQDTARWKIQGPDGKEIRIEKSGYWLNAIGQMRMPNPKDGKPKLLKAAEAAHFAFLKLANAMTQPGRYTLTDPFGFKTEFKWTPRENISRAIKYNQLGYAPDAGRKYAYFGAWLGSAGPMDSLEFKKKPFFLIDASTGKTVFTGETAACQRDVFTKNGAPYTGEKTIELDFSKFSTPGNYYLELPGAGRTPDFKIGNDTLGEAFYLHTRGLYHQRCGTVRSKPWTNWTTSGACHTETRQGNFPPNDKHYGSSKAPRKFGFTDENGKSIPMKVFDIIMTYGRKGDVLKGVSGGWHDAGDYDRRMQHLDAVNDLLSAWLFSPENFTDGQLNIPESGNGIPDIVDEALYGMEVWRKAQNPNGGTGMWIETNGHPFDKTLAPQNDYQKYYLSAATRNGTLRYAALAGMMANVLKKLGAAERSALYGDSAKRAFDFALNPANRCQQEYTVLRKKRPAKVHYQEEPDLETNWLFKAAFNLYLFTGEGKYLDEIKKNEKKLIFTLGDLSWKITPFMFADYQTLGKNIPGLGAIRARYEGLIRRFGNENLSMLDNNWPYRTIWYSAKHHFVTHMSWGVSDPLSRARYLIAAWKLTGDKRYRDGAFLANDFHNGANPLGLSMTSGVGKIYPVRFLHIPSYNDGIPEFQPGITLYRHTYRIPLDDASIGHGLYSEKRLSHGFAGVRESLLPESVTKGLTPTIKKNYELLSQCWPVWRRFANIEAYTVAVSEFTVNETISPAAAVTGCLMSPGYMPSAELRERKSAKDIRTLPGYMVLP